MLCARSLLDMEHAPFHYSCDLELEPKLELDFEVEFEVHDKSDVDDFEASSNGTS